MTYNELQRQLDTLLATSPPRIEDLPWYTAEVFILHREAENRRALAGVRLTGGLVL